MPPITRHAGGVADPGLPKPRIVAAALFILAGSALVAGTTVLAKMLGTATLGDPLHPFQISHGRFIFALIALVAVCAVMRPRFTRPHLPLHAARAICGWLTVSLLFFAATMIPLSDAVAISFLSPIVTMVLAGLLLRERVGRSRWTAAVISMGGAVVLLRPGEGALAIGALAALVAALTMGLEMTIVKRLTRTEGTLQILLFSNLIGTTIATIAVVAVFVMPSAQQWAALAALGVLMLCAQMCWVEGMRLADASFAVPVSYTTLVFAALYDAVIFAVWPDGPSVLGAALILCGALVLTLREPR